MSGHRISASWDDLQRQASMSADYWFGQALKTVREELGETMSVEKMRLAIDLAAIAQRDFATSTRAVAAQNLCDSIDGLASAMERP